ncbi:hypothetical protein A6X21_01750 [Planctopirus hydrillae]|uniref:Uncharacterized protein n=1 Tax=Planctopirus hydrillae TaxID=1841610 RepID=A0A1C3EU44_9PLAN|nr:hypothetical protein A6X21_01750 [Planctopirus hydrillae]
MKRIRDRSPVEDLCSMLAALKSREPMKTSDLNHAGKSHALSQSLKGRTTQRRVKQRRATQRRDHSER